MPGPAPSPHHAHRHKKSTTAALIADPEREVPPLPEFPPLPIHKDPETGVPLPQEPWNPLVLEFWDDVWTGPTGGQYAEGDRQGLLIIATAFQKLYNAKDDDAFQKMAAEIRLQSRRFGLDPMSRANLNWTVAEGKGAVEKQVERERKRQETRERRQKARQVEVQQSLPEGMQDAEVVDAEAEAEISALEG